MQPLPPWASEMLTELMNYRFAHKGLVPLPAMAMGKPPRPSMATLTPGAHVHRDDQWMHEGTGSLQHGSLAPASSIQRPQDSSVSRNPIWREGLSLVKKADGSIRCCEDARGVIALTRRDAYPLPHNTDCLDSLARAKYFCSMDLNSGFWHVALEKSSQPKTAFCTPGGGSL